MSKEFKSILKCKIKNKSTEKEIDLNNIISINQDEENIKITQYIDDCTERNIIYNRKNYDIENIYI